MMQTDFSIKHLKTGDVLNVHAPFHLFKPIRWLMALVRMITRCYYNHTAIAIRIWDQVYVAEADIKGITITPFQHWAEDLYVKVCRPVKPFSEKDVAPFILQQMATPYDYKATLFYQLLFAITGKWYGCTTGKTGKMYCSEFVAYVYNHLAGWFPDWYQTTPATIAESTFFKLVYRGTAKSINQLN